jgi:hypothetical protein
MQDNNKGINKVSDSYVCGVFTSWSYVKVVDNKKMITLHFAINRFVGEDTVHYDLPSNNLDKNHKKRVALYLELELEDMPSDMDNLSNFKFVDKRFNNITHKKSEYVLAISYTTKPVAVTSRTKEGKPNIECYYFSMGADSIISISEEGNYLWTEDNQNTRKIDIDKAVDIISNNIVKVPDHISNRSTAFLI